jgi:thiamine pyrophosphate-dependent acetolactate synthase large subunit-like protein
VYETWPWNPLPEAFRKAFKLAQSEKLGPTHIEIPNLRTYPVANH